MPDPFSSDPSRPLAPPDDSEKTPLEFQGPSSLFPDSRNPIDPSLPPSDPFPIPYLPIHRLRFICKLDAPRGFRNPGVFSYERHLAFERIHTIGFLSLKNGWAKVGEGLKNPLLLLIERWRDHIRQFIE